MGKPDIPLIGEKRAVMARRVGGRGEGVHKSKGGT